MNSKNAVHTQHFFDVKQSTENEMRVSGQALFSPIADSFLTLCGKMGWTGRYRAAFQKSGCKRLLL
jgi:hypothetical protein